jgi:HEAT repeat protein
MNEALTRESSRIRTIAEGEPSSSARDELEAALRSKHHGVRVIAAQALGTWGGRRSVEALKAAFERDLGLRRHFSLRKQYLSALAQCYHEQDIPWILDVHFAPEVKHPDSHFIRRELIATMSHRQIRDRVLEEAKSPDPDRRLKAAHVLVFTNDPFPGAEEVLNRMLQDPVKAIRKKARMLRNHPHAV